MAQMTTHEGMALIFNATNEVQSVKAVGNWYTFKPKEIKAFYNANIADFIAQERREYGLVLVDGRLSDLDFRNSEEGKALLTEYEDRGIDQFIDALRARIANNQISLRQDLEKANLKMDPAILASTGEIDAMRTVAKYQKNKEDREQQKIDEVKELMRRAGPSGK